MKSTIKLLLTSLIFISVSFPQSQHTIMTYNVLNYPSSTSSIRNPYFQTMITAVLPDILVVQEMHSQEGVNEFLNDVLDVISSEYAAGTFINGPDTDNAIFFKTSSFSFIAHNVIATALRNISEFVLSENSTGDTIRIYSLHLKASTGSTNEQKRLDEVIALRNVTDALPLSSNFIVCGDFNIYGANEPAYQELLDQTEEGYVLDIFNLTGTWNNPIYASYHTQSTRTRQFGGGATGGLDDRFDMILMSSALFSPGGIDYVPGSFVNYGNDGLHYNDSINKPPNSMVSQQIADALHYASDHLPVYANFTFDTTPYVELTSFTAMIEGFYNGTTMVPDTVTVEIRDASPPYTLIDQTKILLNSNGDGTGRFYNAVNGTPYYLILKHRSAVETWSSTPQTFTANSLIYDFTTGSAKAYGNNLILIGSKWCIYGGDINRDGFVETEDLNLIFTDNVDGVAGYVSTDLNGDMYTEVEDLNIVFVNNVLGVERKTPPGYSSKIETRFNE